MPLRSVVVFSIRKATTTGNSRSRKSFTSIQNVLMLESVAVPITGRSVGVEEFTAIEVRRKNGSVKKRRAVLSAVS